MDREIKPLIGVTPWYDYENKLTFIKSGYCEGIIKAGGLPVLLPVLQEEYVLSDIYERVSGILLSGGPDVDARHYGELNMAYNGDISPLRDRMEIYLTRRAINEGMPILGICRGIQIMNAAMGGSIYQDIHLQHKDRELIKHSQQAPKWYPTHEINIKAGSKVRQIFNKENLSVNSFHHQSVKDVADCFEITSLAPDGIIEAIECKEHPFAVGVQWHPELMWEEDILHLEIFNEFVAAADRNAAEKKNSLFSLPLL